MTFTSHSTYKTVWYVNMFSVLPGDISSKVYVCVCVQEYCNMMKRRSRDIETETEEELLLLVFPAHPHGPDHSSGSLSLSSSDKSVSTDNNLVEEYVSDVPFAGESTHTLSLCMNLVYRLLHVSVSSRGVWFFLYFEMPRSVRVVLAFQAINEYRRN